MNDVMFVKKSEGNAAYSFNEVLDAFQSMDDMEMLREVVENAEDRVYVSWASVDVRDHDGEKVQITDIINDQDTLLKRNGPISDTHTNAIVGQTHAYKVLEHPEAKKMGVLHLNRIFDDNKQDDLVWSETQSGKRKGSSVGGFNLKFKFEKDPDTGLMTRIRDDFHQYETANVKDPANPLALNEFVSLVAKSKNPIKKMLSKSEMETVDDIMGYVAGKIAKLKETFDKGYEKPKKEVGKEETKKANSDKNADNVINKKTNDLDNVEKSKFMRDKKMAEEVKKTNDEQIASITKSVGDLTDVVKSLAEKVQKQDAIVAKQEDEKPKEEPKEEPKVEKPEEKKVEETKKEEAKSDIPGEADAKQPEPPLAENSNQESVFKEMVSKQNTIIEGLQKDMASVKKSAETRPGFQETAKVTKARKENETLAVDIAKGTVKKSFRHCHDVSRDMGLLIE